MNKSPQKIFHLFPLYFVAGLGAARGALVC